MKKNFLWLLMSIYRKKPRRFYETKGFYRVSSGREKYSCRGVLSCDTILQNIVNETCLVSEERNAVEKAITELHSTIKDDRGKLLKIEDMFYPVKILELDIPDIYYSNLSFVGDEPF